ISSFMSFIMCFAMLAGTTFAWYTDSVTSSGNKIIAGTLDIQLWMHDGNGYVDISNSSAPIFQSANMANPTNATLWEPGKTQVAYLMIKNAGDLDLKYQVALNVRNVAKNLYEVMKYKIVPDATPDSGVTSWTDTSPAAVANSVTIGDQVVSGTNVDSGNAAGVKLEKGAVHYFALLIHMDEEAGNEYMGGEVDFDLKVLATQVASESDSFGNTYDENREFPVVSTGSATMTGPITGSDALAINANGEIVSASVPAAAANTYYNGKATGTNNEVTLNLNVEKLNETTTSESTTVSLDIDMSAIIKVDNTTTTEKISSLSDYVTINYNLGTGKAINGVTHSGEPMEALASAAASVSNGYADVGGYYYDISTGIITIKTKTFSPFEISYTVKQTKISVFETTSEESYSATTYKQWGDAVAAVEERKPWDKTFIPAAIFYSFDGYDWKELKVTTSGSWSINGLFDFTSLMSEKGGSDSISLYIGTYAAMEDVRFEFYGGNSDYGIFHEAITKIYDFPNKDFNTVVTIPLERLAQSELTLTFYDYTNGKPYYYKSEESVENTGYAYSYVPMTSIFAGYWTSDTTPITIFVYERDGKYYSRTPEVIQQNSTYISGTGFVYSYEGYEKEASVSEQAIMLDNDGSIIEPDNAYIYAGYSAQYLQVCFSGEDLITMQNCKYRNAEGQNYGSSFGGSIPEGTIYKKTPVYATYNDGKGLLAFANEEALNAYIADIGAAYDSSNLTVL
ncbi:MAG: hypothetical protein IJU94_07070, partial [Clostridia bacterium]|nr:hypothetical protein [Clostridia bacterium]